MMDPIASFIDYFRQTLDSKNQDAIVTTDVSNDFFIDFVNYTPSILGELNNCITEKHIDRFYNRLNDLKYLCVFNEELNKYWFSMRALSGALVKLSTKKSLKNAQKVHQYYIRKYGDRKVLSNENWFEQKRWNFLNTLEAISEINQLDDLIDRNIVLLKSYLDHYIYNLNSFIEDIRKTLILKEDF